LQRGATQIAAPLNDVSFCAFWQSARASEIYPLPEPRGSRFRPLLPVTQWVAGSFGMRSQ
jgi:hypothetical protein